MSKTLIKSKGGSSPGGNAADVILKLKQEQALAREHSPLGNPPVMEFEMRDAVKQVPNNLFIVLEGSTSTCRTSFICSAPSPILIFDLDSGLAGVVDRFIDTGQKIKIITITVIAKESLYENQAQANGTWNGFKKLFYKYIDDDYFKTIGIDTGTHLWEIAGWSEMGQIEIDRNAIGKDVLPFHYGKVNQQFRSIMQKALESDKNVIITHRQKEIWNEKGQPTGQYKLAGFKDMDYESRILITTGKEGSGKMLTPVFKLKKCRGFNQQMEGKLYRDYKQCNFQYIAADITGTPIEQWR